MNSAERISAPQGARQRRHPVRRVIGAAAATTVLVFGAAACSDGPERGVDRPTTTEVAGSSPEHVGKATESLLNQTRPELSSIFDALLSNEACTDVVVLDTVQTENGPYLHTELLGARGETFLEMSRDINTDSGYVTRLFARFYVPGSSLSPEEQRSLVSSDNPDGNWYGNEVEVFQVLGQDVVRIDASGIDEQGIFSTQGDQFHQNTEPYGYMGDPLVAAERAQAVVDEVADFIDLAACTAADPHVV